MRFKGGGTTLLGSLNLRTERRAKPELKTFAETNRRRGEYVVGREASSSVNAGAQGLTAPESGSLECLPKIINLTGPRRPIPSDRETSPMRDADRFFPKRPPWPISHVLLKAVRLLVVPGRSVPGWLAERAVARFVGRAWRQHRHHYNNNGGDR